LGLEGAEYCRGYVQNLPRRRPNHPRRTPRNRSRDSITTPEKEPRQPRQ
jgi:hypothetical protein